MTQHSAMVQQVKSGCILLTSVTGTATLQVANENGVEVGGGY